MSSTLLRRFVAPLTVLAVASLALVGCSHASIYTGVGPGNAGKPDGVVTIYGSLSQAEAELLQQSWADWEHDNGIRIEYESVDHFETEIGIRAAEGTAPDLGIFSQPSLVKDLAWQNLIQPAPDEVKANLAAFWSNDWARSVTMTDVVFGAPLLANVKGLIWYSPSQFAANGWAVPTTWNRLVNLTDDMQTQLGVAPWCVDFGTDAKAGSLGTDWLEDLVLRQAGPYTYDAWVRHDVKFSNPAIRKALSSVGKILLHPEYVNSDFDNSDVDNGAPTTTTSAEALAVAMGNGTCSLAHQDMSFGQTLANPEGANLTVDPAGDIWAFLMPSLEAGGNSVVGGGQIVAAFSNDADTIKVQKYLSSAEWANSRVKLGGVVSANNGVDPANASSLILTKATELLQDQKTTFRFDGSDAMPRAVGADSFPTGMGMWIHNWSPNQMLSTIDRSWDSE